MIACRCFTHLLLDRRITPAEAHCRVSLPYHTYTDRNFMKKFVFKNLTYIHKSYIAELLLLCMLLYTHVFRKKHFFQFVFCII
ncbi:hypothetical protein FB379_107117 [Aeribacillus composti]|jgi:hypothetical protein|nr:hypothetical protein FB379_107117 [Aeribacillus composti]